MNLLRLNQNAKTDWSIVVLVFAMTTSVFTERRIITGVGISELIILALGGMVFSGRIPKIPETREKSNILQYFKGVMITIPLGVLWNLVTVRSTFQMVHDFLAFCLAWYLSEFVLKNLITKEKVIEIVYLFLLMGFIVDVWYLKMYRGGSGLYEDARFCGYSTDPNQVVEALCFIPWIGLFFIDYANQKKLPRFYIWGAVGAIMLAIYIGLATDSDSFNLANMVACCVWGIVHYKLTGKSWPIVVIIFVGICYLIYSGGINNVIYRMDNYYNEIAAKDNQLNVRTKVWKYGIMAFFHSPLFGNGPGAHSGNWFPFGKVESHNTYIYILMDHGIIGFILLMTIFKTLIIKIIQSHSSYLLAAMMAMLVFCFFHSFQRMPLFWFYLFLFNCMAEYNVDRLKILYSKYTSENFKLYNI